MVGEFGGEEGEGADAGVQGVGAEFRGDKAVDAGGE